MPKWLSAPCASQFIDFTGKGNKNDKNRWMQDRLSWNLTWLFKKPLSNESLQSHLEHQMKCPPLIHRPKPGVWSYRRTCLHSPPTSYSGGKRSRGKGDGSRLRGPAGEMRTHTQTQTQISTPDMMMTLPHIKQRNRDSLQSADHRWPSQCPWRGCCSALSRAQRRSGCPFCG